MHARSSPGAVGTPRPTFAWEKFHGIERIERSGRARCPQRAGTATAALNFTVEPKCNDDSGSRGGIEGEGSGYPYHKDLAFPPLTPALSPLRGEGDGSASRFYGGASSFTTVVIPRCALADAPAKFALARAFDCAMDCRVNLSDRPRMCG